MFFTALLIVLVLEVILIVALAGRFFLGGFVSALRASEPEFILTFRGRLPLIADCQTLFPVAFHSRQQAQA